MELLPKLPIKKNFSRISIAETCYQWRSQDLKVGAPVGVWGTEVPQRGPGAEPLVGGSGGGIASRKYIAVIKDIWLSNHAQFCVFSSTAQPGIFL